MRTSTAIATSSFATLALADKGDDTIVLKGGTVVTGKILDEDPKNGVTIKLATGKVRVLAPAEIKSVEHAKPAKSEPRTEAPDDAPAKPPATDADEPKKPEPSTSKAHEGVKLGVGLELGLVLSRANTDGSLTLLSPSVGAHLAIDVGLAPRVYLRIDPSLSTFSRSSQVPGVPLQFDATTTPGVLSTRTVGTKLRVIDLSTRVEVGYDFTDAITSRIGGAVGLAFGLASGDVCNSATDLGVVYGLSTHPIGVRLGESRSVEVALAIDYASVPVSRCTTNVPAGFVPPSGAISVFQPLFLKDRIGIGVAGLSATYAF
jgi:hypothetical protein